MDFCLSIFFFFALLTRLLLDKGFGEGGRAGSRGGHERDAVVARHPFIVRAELGSARLEHLLLGHQHIAAQVVYFERHT